MPRYPSIEDRLWMNVDTSAGEDGCWVWTSRTDRGGYGRLRAESPSKRSIRAHRLSYAISNGIDPLEMSPDLVIRHACDNPSHLISGTMADNNRDKLERGRNRGPYEWVDGTCVKGHDVSNPSNVYLSNGKRSCRVCLRIRARKSKQRAREARLNAA